MEDSKKEARELIKNNPELAEALSEAIQFKLGSLLGKSSGYIESLPRVTQDRIVALRVLQDQHSELERQFQLDLVKLEQQYEEKYSPLYETRRKVINAEVKAQDIDGFEKKKKEIEDEKKKAEEEDGAKKAEKAEVEEKEDEDEGIPEFWLSAMKNLDDCAAQITETDEEVLAYLKDVRSANLGSSGFRLDFVFRENPFFSNEVLSKTYHLINDFQIREVIMDHSEGTKIDWKPDKDVTVKLVTAKQRKKGRGGGRQTRTVQREEPCESFFNFFKPPQLPDADQKLSEDEIDALEELVEDDYRMGQMIHERLVPQAVLFFTGEACDGSDDEDEDSEEYTDDDDEDGEKKGPSLKDLLEGSGQVDDADSDEDPDFQLKPKRKGPGGQQKGGEPAPECKQQ